VQLLLDFLHLGLFRKLRFAEPAKHVETHRDHVAKIFEDGFLYLRVEQVDREQLTSLLEAFALPPRFAPQRVRVFAARKSA
jgi:hypothetical protein